MYKLIFAIFIVICSNYIILNACDEIDNQKNDYEIAAKFIHKYLINHYASKKFNEENYWSFINKTIIAIQKHASFSNIFEQDCNCSLTTYETCKYIIIESIFIFNNQTEGVKNDYRKFVNMLKRIRKDSEYNRNCYCVIL